MAKGVTLTVYQFIKAYIKKHTHPPTIREIGKACHLSTAGVTRHLERLEGEGKLYREPNRPRGITLTGDDD